MYHFATALFAGTVLVAALHSCLPPRRLSKMSKAEKVALKEATVACKAQAKGMKIRWPASRKYVKNCIIRTTLKSQPNMDVIELRKAVN